MGLDPVSHKPLVEGHTMASTHAVDAKPPFTMLNHHMTQWENARVEAESRMAKQYCNLAHENPDIVAGFGVENESSDYFLRAWKSDAGEAFRRGSSFPNSHLQQLHSYGLDVNGFLLMQHYNEPMRAQQQYHQQPIPLIDANHTLSSLLLQQKSIAKLPTNSSSNSAALCVDHLSPTSPLSSADCSALYQSPEPPVAKQPSVIRFSSNGDLDKEKRSQENGGENADVAGRVLSIIFHTTNDDLDVGKVKHQEDPIRGENVIDAENEKQTGARNWASCVAQPIKDEEESNYRDELEGLARTSLQWSQIEQSLVLTSPKPVIKPAIKDEEMVPEEESMGSENKNTYHDLGLKFFMPLLATEMLDFGGEDAYLEGNEVSKSSFSTWQDQFTSSAAAPESNGEHYWGSLMKAIMASAPSQPNCFNAAS